MYCKKCGNPLLDTMKFCDKCGTSVAEDMTESLEYPMEKTYSELEYLDKPLVDRFDYRDEIKKAPAAERRFNRNALIIMSVLLSLIAVVGVVLGIMFFGGSGGAGSSKPTLTVDGYPSQTDTATLTLSGTASSKKDATITINGQVVDGVGEADGTKKWSKEVTLVKGVNTFNITVSDNNGNSANQQISIVYTSNLLYEAGTILIKGNPSAVYVRPTPQKGKKYVILIPANDFTSQFVCLGEESRDSEGYIWCKVQTPSSGIGWIRSDLVKPLQ